MIKSPSAVLPISSTIFVDLFFKASMAHYFAQLLNAIT
jgi:hypothetical protein